MTDARRGVLSKWTRRVACLVVVAVAALGSLQGYRGWRKSHLSQRIEHFVAQGDYRNAVLVARRLLELDPNNLAASRAFAEMAENSGSAEAISWRQKVVQLEPASSSEKISLGRTALRFGQVEVAARALDLLPATERNSAGYHQVAGAVALAKRETREGE